MTNVVEDEYGNYIESVTTAPSGRMKARQSARQNGRYAEMNRCEACGRSLGVDYYSDPRTCNDGAGLVLCARDCAKGMEMPEADETRFGGSAGTAGTDESN